MLTAQAPTQDQTTPNIERTTALHDQLKKVNAKIKYDLWLAHDIYVDQYRCIPYGRVGSTGTCAGKEEVKYSFTFKDVAPKLISRLNAEAANLKDEAEAIEAELAGKPFVSRAQREWDAAAAYCAKHNMGPPTGGIGCQPKIKADGCPTGQHRVDTGPSVWMCYPDQTAR